MSGIIRTDSNEQNEGLDSRLPSSITHHALGLLSPSTLFRTRNPDFTKGPDKPAPLDRGCVSNVYKSRTKLGTLVNTLRVFMLLIKDC